MQLHSALSTGQRDVKQPLRRFSKNIIESGTAGPLETQFLILRLPREDGTYAIEYSSPCDNHDNCFYPVGRRLRMHFVSTFLPLPPNVMRSGEYKFSMKPENMPPELAGAK